MTERQSTYTDLIDTPTGYRIPVRWRCAKEARGSVILMAALGMKARFYAPLADAVSSLGLNVALLEQRGHGDSALRPSRQVDFGFREALEEELPLTMAWVREKAPSAPLFLMGHSLGGHYAVITAGRFPAKVAGVITVACGSPWVGGFQGLTQWQLRLLCLLIPLLNRTFGYYPGHRVGFGGREARTLMADWLMLARTNQYRVQGLGEDLERGIRRYAGPVLSLRPADDSYAPEASMDAVTNKLVSATLTKGVITAAELGDRADHFRWARQPQAVVRHLQEWISQHLSTGA